MCGIFGISGHTDAARLAFLGLFALQHRGEESAGIVTYDGKRTHAHQGMGLAGDVFDEKTIRGLRGNIAVGHVRYSTTGSSHVRNVQPFMVHHKRGHLAIAHNGNLTNTRQLREMLEEQGSIFQSSMDSEIIVHLLAQCKQRDLKRRIITSLGKLEGAYSLVMLVDEVLIGACDPYGFRPLCLGKLDGAYVLASETCALDLIQAEYVRPIEPGEIVFIQGQRVESCKPFPRRRPAHCIFEFIYFSRPDSLIFGASVYAARKRLGEQLSREYCPPADMVTPIPDSGNYAALGFANAAQLPYEPGIIRNHYIGRTFIQPSQFIRDFRVRVKLNPTREVLRGKRVVIVEDSIVRGTTSKARVKTVRDAGCRSVHMCVSCPPIRYPCFYGIDFPTRKELIAARFSPERIRRFMGLDSLCYLSHRGMLASLRQPGDNFCTACFTGKYPTKTPKKFSKKILE